MLDVGLEELAVPDSSGRPFAIARVPRIERRFASPMHTTAGMPPKLGGWREALAAFLGGWLPSARLRPAGSREVERAEVRGAVIRAIEEGFAGSVRVNADGELYGYLARPDRIAATIEIDALAADYLDVLGDERYRAEYIRGAIVDGIVLGDDPAQTCAHLLYELTGDQRLWETGRSRRFRRQPERDPALDEAQGASAPGA